MEPLPIKEVYNILSKHTEHGIEGYQVDKKYLDPRKLKQQKLHFEESIKKPKFVPPKPVKHKSNYLDDLQKEAAKLPSPFTYNVEQEDIGQRSKAASTKAIHGHANRKTIFQELENKLKKDNFPGSANYQPNPDGKDNKHSNIAKSQQPNYAEASQRHSIQVPGVGQYNGKDERLKWLKHFVEWKKPAVMKVKKPETKLPAVGTYSPRPVSYSLFESIDNKAPVKGTKTKDLFGKQQRWKKVNPSKLPQGDYNVLSQWGLKQKLKKKDILDRVTRPTRGSVYY